MKYRMYTTVLRQLEPMQKGIQSTHAIVEYQLHYNTKEYMQWATEDPTLVELSGGTSFDMNDIRDFLNEHKIKYASFNEPDMYNITTAYAFLLPEMVWDSKQYMSYEDFINLLDIDESKGERVKKEYWASRIFNMTLEEVEEIMVVRDFIFRKKLAK